MQRGRALGGEPVRGDREVVGGVEPLCDPPGRGLGGQPDGARGDVDVGDLLRDGLELRQRPAELPAVLDVGRGERAGPGDDPVAEEAEAGDRVLAQHVVRRSGHVGAEQVVGADPDAVQHQGVLGLAA